MRQWKNTISRIALLQVAALGVPMLSACELRLPGNDSDSTDSFDDQEPAAPLRLRGETTSAPPLMPVPGRARDAASGDRPAAPSVSPDRLAAPARPEPSHDGSGTGSYVDLLVLDPRSIGGARASNADPDAAWSFRAQMGWLAGSDTGALAFTVRWLESWQSLTSVGMAAAPVSARPALRGVLLEPWLGEEETSEVSTTEARLYAPSEEFGDGSSPTVPDAGASQKPPLDPYGSLPPDVWAAAPFRLLAIVNRVDLAADACGSAAGELRYVYTATDASGEQALDLSVIVEIPYPSTRSAASWARSWREMAAKPPGSERDGALLALTREVTLEADPLRARVRTNEAALSEGPWQMREFQLASSSAGELELRQVPLAFTPRADADLGQLAEQLLANSADVLGGGFALPEALRAGTAEMSDADFSWRVPGISERLRSAFSSATCNGCHAGDTKTERFQHIAPGASPGAPARLSRFLQDEEAPTDELRRREALLVELSETRCSDDPPSTSGRYKP
jgi:hypothetical protein